MTKLADEIKQTKPFRSLEQEVYLNLLRTADVLAGQFEELLKPALLTGTQYNVLRILRGAGESGLPCGEVSNRMITKDPDVTRLLDRLEKRSLISRCRGTRDRRVVNTRITEQGLSLLASLDDGVHAKHKQQLGHLQEQGLRMLLQLLEQARSGPGL